MTSRSNRNLRPKVGEADPATRRKFLDAALKPGPPVKMAPKPAPATGVSPNAARLLRDRGKQIDRSVSENDR